MALRTRARNGAARIRQSSWETRVAVGAPVLIAALTLPIMFGAFSGASEGTNGTGTASYGPVPTTVPAVPTTTAVAGSGASTGATTGATGAGTATAPVEANPQTAG